MNKHKRLRGLIAVNLIGGPILFLLGSTVAFSGTLSYGHIISIILIGFGAFAARSYLSPKGRVSKTVALVVNSVALLVSGAQLIANYLRIDTFAENSKGEAAFLGIGIPIIPVIILCITLYFLINPEKSLDPIGEKVESEFEDGVRLMRTNKYNDALEYFQQALTQSHSRVEKAALKYNIAICKVKQGDRAEAEEILKEALSLDPVLSFSAEKDEDLAGIIGVDITSIIKRTKRRKQIKIFIVSLVISLFIAAILAGFLEAI